MLRKLFTLLAVALTLPVFAQTNLVQRRVLIEEFTQASCGPCAAQNPTFNVTLADNAQYLTPIKYQTDWPGYDPMNLHNPDEVQARVDYYGVDGVPNGRQNGILEVFPMTAYDAATINAAYNTLTPVSITLSHEVTASKEVNITVAVKSTQALSGSLKLRVAVTESELHFDNPPGTNGELEFFNVMKKMLPDADGTATGDFAADETKTYTFTWPLKNYYNLNEVEVVAWLQDDATKEVWQSERSVPNTNFVDAQVLIGGGANQLFCQNSFDPQVAVTNSNAAALTSATFIYNVDGVAYTYDWTGNIASNETQIVTLPTVTFAASGTHSIDIKLGQTNNGEQLTQLNIIAFTANSMFAAATAPVTEGFQAGVLPPAGWGMVNFSPTGWSLTAPGGYGTSNKSLKADFFNLASGTLELHLPKLDLPTDPANLKYDWAYTYYNTTYADSLSIDISTDCGATWTNLYNKWAAGLATAPAKTTAFTPTAAQWKSQTIDLSAYAGQTVNIRFQGRSGYGNNLYIDNINIVAAPVGTKEALALNTFTVQPNPASDAAEVRFDLEKSQPIQLNIFNLQGVRVQSLNLGELVAGQHVAQIDATRLPAGSYRVTLQGTQGIAQTQLVVIK